MTASEPADLVRLSGRWRDALASWAIPDEILAQAPASPWAHPPALFRAGADDSPPDTASFALAREALGGGGTVLDVGCGGGRSSLPLGPAVTAVTGVDEQQAMLDQFAEAARDRAIPCSTVLGRWPDVAASVPAADVVVCHHVAYNVGDIVPFLDELTRHARRRVVLELTARHPLSALNPLWERFWGLARPTEPTADLLVEVVRAMGHEPTTATGVRVPRRNRDLDRESLVAFVRQRLCLPAARDPEIDDALGEHPELSVDAFVTVAWTGTAG
jgi:SAM-dependent methyltransferase